MGTTDTLQDIVEALADEHGQQNLLYALWIRAKGKSERAVLPENIAYWAKVAAAIRHAANVADGVE